jgi:hypothetical protein
MEKLLQPLKQEGFTEEIWKSLTAAPDTETDLLSDGEPRPSTTRSPENRGTKRTADGERKGSWGDTAFAEDEYIPAKVQSPPAAMPLEARAEGTDDEEDYKPAMYIQNMPPSNTSALPELEIQEHLAETYFANCHVPYIVLHKPSFMSQLEQGTVAPALVLAVCAVSARYRPR